MELRKCLCIQHAFCFKGGFGSAETCIKLKQLMQMMKNGLFMLCVCIAVFLPQSTLFSMHSDFVLILEPKV